MFEEQKKQEPRSKAGILIGVGIIVIVCVALYFYVNSKGSSGTNTTTATAASVGSSTAAAGPSDAVKDLRIIDPKMQKDYSGTTAQWLLDVKNDSQVYTYSNIGYQTTYYDGNNNVLASNKGQMNLTISPGDEQNTQFRDILYPDGTAWYRVVVTGATATK
jgi:hypothetical protein